MPVGALSRWPWWRRWFCDRSERAAVRYLKQLKYRIHTRNFLCPGGEIDIVALDGPCLVFAEVRSTASANPRQPVLSITDEKKRRMTHAALQFMQKKRLRDPAARFDVLIVCWPPGAREPRIDHYPSAFAAIGRFQMGR
jgi:putative endonuclease